MIVHLRVVPGLWIAVEELRRPEIRSRPVIMGGLPHQRGVVREANIPAQSCGVRAGMTLSQAHQQCPEGLFLVPDLPHYERAWAEICEVLRAYTPLVEPVEMGQAACDLSGCERRWQDSRHAAREIAWHVRQCTNIAPWLGVATNRLVAQLASTTGGADNITVVGAGQEARFLADLPLTSLPDVDPQLALTFQVLGLRTIGQFAALPAAAVKRRFGVVGERLHSCARGIDPRPVVPPPARPAVSARYECEDGSLEEATAALQQLAATCASELQRRHLAGRLVELRLIHPAPHPPLLRDLRPLALPGERGAFVTPPSPLEAVGAASGTEGIPAQSGRRGGEGFSIPYRIHSMLPQPGREPGTALQISPSSASPAIIGPQDDPRRRSMNRTKTCAVVRTPIDTPAPLVECAQRLLLQSWPRASSQSEAGNDREELPRRQLQALELEVSEFEAPAQLSFSEFNRLDQTGRLAGLDAGRLQALAAQEELLAARYSDASFRHVASVDPNNVLTERRVRWQIGLVIGRAHEGVGRSRASSAPPPPAANRPRSRPRRKA